MKQQKNSGFFYNPTTKFVSYTAFILFAFVVVASFTIFNYAQANSFYYSSEDTYQHNFILRRNSDEVYNYSNKVFNSLFTDTTDEINSDLFEYQVRVEGYDVLSHNYTKSTENTHYASFTEDIDQEFYDKYLSHIPLDLLYNVHNLIYYSEYPYYEEGDYTQAPTSTPLPNTPFTDEPIVTDYGTVAEDTTDYETITEEIYDEALAATTITEPIFVNFEIEVTPTDYFYSVYADGLDSELSIQSIIYANKYNILYIYVASCILMAISSVFSMICAGKKEGYYKVYTTRFNKIPLDIMFAVEVVGLALYAYLVNVLYYEIFYNNYYGFPTVFYLSIFIVTTLVAVAYTLYYFINTAIAIKEKKFFKRTLFYIIMHAIYKRTLGLFVDYFLRSPAKKVVKRTILGFVIFLAIQMFIIAIFGGGLYSFLAIALQVIFLFPVAISVNASIKRISFGAGEIARGNLSYKVDTDRILFIFKPLSEHINNMGHGINVALEEKMKSERLKTELITNVSHDIKTPLTSIINYVDLIKKEDIDSDKVKEYLEVLDRQSNKLKKLIENLMDVSKLSSGNVKSDLTATDISLLIEQIEGEYKDNLSAVGLELICQKEEQPIFVMADIKHLQRIFDNVMGNVKKYAMPNTRVYINIEKTDGKAIVHIKNMSKGMLNISEDELMERFVRGDSSRNTDGNGLGLSITKSLMETQKGDMKISIDGDLFKVSLIFSEINP